jgi:hypothetical protein
MSFSLAFWGMRADSHRCESCAAAIGTRFLARHLSLPAADGPSWRRVVF